jgi:hydroxyacylglutathione hydrolase
VGPPLLGELPKPAPLDADGLIAASESEDTVVIDTRLDRKALMAGHLPGSLYARFDRSFSAIVGSYVRPEQKIVLLIDEEQLDEDRVDEAVRDLVRIGFDHVVGFAPSSILEDPALESRLDSLDVVDFDALEDHRRDPGTVVLDVRGAGEYASGHVPDSLHIAHTRLLDRLDEVPTDGTVWVHCQSGARATASAALLERSGRRVKLVFDAFPKWTERAARA